MKSKSNSIPARGRAARAAIRIAAAGAVLGGTVAAASAAPVLNENPVSCNPKTGVCYRYGDQTRREVAQTNTLTNCFFAGPRGRDYSLLPNPRPVQQANLYPGGSLEDYWATQFNGIPKGTRIVLHGRYPYARFTSFAIEHILPGNVFVSSKAEDLTDMRIKPDKGSLNPAIPGHRRLLPNRNYTFNVLVADAPANPAHRKPNSLYLGSSGTGLLIYRVEGQDVGVNGAGGVPLPTYSAILPNGQHLGAQQTCKQLVTPFNAATKPLGTPQQWIALTHLPGNDPATAPATNPSKWFKFFAASNLTNQFLPPDKQIKTLSGTQYGKNPDINYILSFINRKFDPVYVIHAKMPTFPNTEANPARMTSGQVGFWELCQDDAPPSGKAYDCLFDFQVPVNRQREYTIVVSRPGDRPANATDRCGVAWLNWGHIGDGITAAEGNRPDAGLLIMRFDKSSPNWANSGDRATVPGTERKIMGPYFPQGSYTTKAAFQKRGCKA